MHQDGFHFGGHHDSIELAPSDKQGLFPKPVACHKQTSCAFVPQRKSEHAIEPAQSVLAPFAQRHQQNLGIAARVKADAHRFELVAQFNVVVDLAIEDDLQRTVVRRHWLIRGMRHVDNGQAPMGQTDAVVASKPIRTVVRATMNKTISHQSKKIRSNRHAGRNHRHEATHQLLIRYMISCVR